MPTCDECGSEFDTERGLATHARQMHEAGAEYDPAADVESRLQEESTKSTGDVTLSLSVKHALLATFVVGMFAGGFFMAAITGATGLTGVFADTSDTGNGNGGTPNNGGSPAEDTIDPSQISLDGQPTLGSADAPVTVVVYEDFECPFCQRFEQNAGSRIVSEYVESGKVQLVWKDFPLTQIHPWAQPAAEIMECVYRQDEQAFWTVKDQVFANQNSIDQNNVQDHILQYAADAGVSRSAVQSCLQNGDPSSEVQADLSEGRSLGVSGTPTVFVNGQKIVGAQPFGAFQQVIESELNR